MNAKATALYEAHDALDAALDVLADASHLDWTPAERRVLDGIMKKTNVVTTRLFELARSEEVAR